MLFRKHGLAGTVQKLRSALDVNPSVRHLRHPAARYLTYLGKHGAPVQVRCPVWTPTRLEQANRRGPHKSAIEYRDFMYEEMATMADKGQWLILPFELVKDLPGLRLSPIGVVPQHSRRPRTIVDYSYYGINQDTVPLTAKEAMQFGRALQRLLQRISEADPRHGPVHMIKVDLSDGFYRIRANPHHVARLGVSFPPAPDGTSLVAFPMVLPMGWVNSPPMFSGATETVADMSNERLRRHAKAKPHHRLEYHATNVPDDHRTWPHEYKHPPGPPKPPLSFVDVYVDDFLGLAQGTRARLKGVRRIIFEEIDNVFRPKVPSDPDARSDPISIKKLKKGDASWSTTKELLGWTVDSILGTIRLPERRLQRLQELLAGLPRTKKRIATKLWHKVLGELRSMTLAVPGLRGMFSLLQETLRHADSRTRLTTGIHDFLDDIRWLHQQLERRPTHIRETYPRTPFAYGACDASGEGMGGVYFHPQPKGPPQPYLWRHPFTADIQQRLVSQERPRGTITNSDLELAAIVAQHDVVMQLPHPAMPTIFTASDNTPAIAWQRKGSATTTGPAAYLLRLQALHQRHHRYYPVYAHLAGTRNVMADDCSRHWHLSDDDLLTHFCTHYPQATPWRLLPLRTAMHSSLTSALQRKRPEPDSFLPPEQPPMPPGDNGRHYARTSMLTPFYKRSTIPSPSSKSTPTACEPGKLPAVVTQSGLAQLAPPSVKWARRWPYWGPVTLA